MKCKLSKMLPQLSCRRRHVRNARKIEIDITYKCNLKCPNCNRSVPQAPSREQMSVEQIARFVDESVQRNIKWDSIMVIGGEPTLHPDLGAMLDLLLAYRADHSAATTVVLATNGVGKHVSSVLATIPPEVQVLNSDKAEKVYKHKEFNDAPCDSLFYALTDYTWACPITQDCGTGLTPYGYYVCPVAGSGIDRVFGFDMGRKTLPDDDDQMNEQRRALCRLCGHFKQRRFYDHNVITRSWSEGYERFSVKPPTLTAY